MEFELIAKTLQGLENVLAEELTHLGANNIEIGRRMVAFTGDKEMMYRANIQLRTAIRILKPIMHFHAKTADEVYDAVKSIDWTQYLTNRTTFAVDSVVYSSEFRHSKMVAYKVKDAIVDQMREKTGDRPNIRLKNPDLQLHIHVAEYDCTLALDSSGESLHRRGYRAEQVEAPLNEVLAAGIILMTGWRGECDFIDPMCGSGTFPIEAALIARGISPGVFRSEFAFEKWSDFDRELFERVYNDDSDERPFNHHIYGYDINVHAVAIATRNVKAAGLSKEITIEQRDIKNFETPAKPSILITNPPYGERISAPDLLGLYKLIGTKLKHNFTDGEAWILSYREECFDEIGLKPSRRIPLYNGSLECELRKYQIFSGKFNDMRAGGGDIKTREDRRDMAQRKFKQHREFKERIGEQEEERPRRRFDDGEKPRRRFDDGEKPRRRFDDNEKPRRRFDDDDRKPRRRFDDGEKPHRHFEDGKRPRKRFDDDRRRPFDKDRKPRKNYDDKKPRGGNGRGLRFEHRD